ncbi:hypothetical protein QQM39_39220 [Streptomyces sp. DT2A-34]|uniref:hypothetical protein n=1 Tax=Streptomyces sp. DT2A-34 TaxID=3051182 RepID=UPI00265B8EE3|nr:hypothetical protein [Streptomyces sp. DT2A-34]MDO0916636.1 hypothetical protein [Streptomyces sp. DT2A-34]
MKWLDPGRGVGVIAQECAGPDAVACRAAVNGDADSTLVVGERVSFDLALDAAGVRAARRAWTPAPSGGSDER